MAVPFEPRRIALFCHRLDSRAIARVCAVVAGELARLGRETSLVVTGVAGEHVPVSPAVEVVDLAAPVDKSAAAVPALARWLRRARPDVLFAQHNGPNRAAVLARALARSPAALVLVEQNHYSSYISPSGGGWRHRRLRDRMTAFLYPRADRVAGVAPEILDDLADRFPATRDKLDLLPNPGPDPARVAELAAAAPDHAWLVEPRAWRVVTSVANVIPRKGQDVLIEAWPEVRRRAGDVRLVLVGRHDNLLYLATLERRARELGIDDDVAFVGYRENPLPFIARADAFALASRNEGAPLVLLEAMACAVPIVATDCLSGPAYLLEGGRAGGLVPVDDVRALAAALADSLLDTAGAARKVAAGRRRAAEFSPRRVAEAYLALGARCGMERGLTGAGPSTPRVRVTDASRHRGA